MSSCLNGYDEYFEFIIEEIENNVPSYHSDYGRNYYNLQEVIENGLKINISLPSYKDWLLQKERDKKLNELGI